MERAVKPHDLLRIVPPSLRDAPAWVEAALIRAPLVVVRRAPLENDRIPVGIRGSTRSERFGTWIEKSRILEVTTPEDLRAVKPERDLPAFALLNAIIPVCNTTALDWGPAGSTAFELASRQPTVTATSDLDLIMRMPTPMQMTDARTLFETLSQAAFAQHIRIDIQIETPCGAFALAEFARPHQHILLRHPNGPRLVTDPWSEDSETLDNEANVSMQTSSGEIAPHTGQSA
jgi:phosphoribosyl-dephospho-CoA transferase